MEIILNYLKWQKQWSDYPIYSSWTMLKLLSLFLPNKEMKTEGTWNFTIQAPSCIEQCLQQSDLVCSGLPEQTRSIKQQHEATFTKMHSHRSSTLRGILSHFVVISMVDSGHSGAQTDYMLPLVSRINITNHDKASGPASSLGSGLQ